MALPAGTVWPWKLGVLGDVATDVRCGRLVAQQLLDGGVDERPVLDDLAALVRMVGQHLAGPADEPGGGLVAGPGDHGEVGEQLVAGEAAARAVSSSNSTLSSSVMMSSDGCSTRQSTYSANMSPRREALVAVHRLAGLGAEVGVDLVPHRLLVLLGDAQQHPDHAHRHLGAEVTDEVEPTGPDEWVERVGAELAHLRLERRDLPGREHPREEAAMDGVGRRVLEDHRPGRHLHARLDQLEDAAPAGDERVPVLAGPARRRRSG